MADRQNGVYFIYAPNQGRIKIGRSRDISLRHKNLQTGFMDEGILLCGILTDKSVKLERELHLKFNHLRVEGEWFVLTKELIDFVLTIKTKFPLVVIYHDLNILQRSIVYNNLDTISYAKKIKTVLFKVVIPILFLVAGCIIAYYFFKYSKHSFKHHPWYIGFLILLPIITVALPRMVVEYCSFKKAVWYFTLIAANLLLGAIALTPISESSFFMLLQITTIITYIVYSRQLLLEISFLKTDEVRRKKIADSYSWNELELFAQAEKLASDKKKRQDILKKVGIVNVSLTYVCIHAAIFFSETVLSIKLLILGTLNIGIFIWLILIYKNLAISKQSYVLSSVTFLIIAISSTDDRAFIDIVLLTLMPLTTIGLGFLAWYSIRDRLTNVALDEVEKQLNHILSDKKDQIEKLEDQAEKLKAKLDKLKGKRTISTRRNKN